MRIGHVHVVKLTPAQQALVADDGPWARSSRDVWNAALQERLERPKPRMRRGIKDKPKVAQAA